MKVTNFAIEHSTAVFVLIACIVIGGIGSYISLPKEAAPDVQIPVVIVSTPYFGVSPADIETLVTQPLEKEFKGLRDLDKMTSTSAESVSLVTLEFNPDVDIDEALQKVREKVDKAGTELPEDAEEPEIIEINASDWPILIANVSGDMDLVRLKTIGEDLEEEIEKVPGVLRVDIAGGVEREIKVNLDPEKMRQYGVSVNQVIGAIQSENVNLPGGSIEMGPMKYTVRVPGEFEDVPEIEDIVVKAPEGQPVFLRDVAEVVDGFKEQETKSRLTTWVQDGDERRRVTQSNISLSVVKRSGENIIDIADDTKKIIDKYETKFASDGLEVVVLNDMSEDIKTRVSELENNIISGLILVLGVLFFFMGGARNALFVAISIPMSMLLSFLVLQALGVTMNMVVLFSLVLALGMLVDNAIVVVENIYRHASEGKDRKTAAKEGTEEVGWAIIASTATTVGAFFPMLFWPGIMGEFMGYLPLTVIIVLLSSLFVALVINPTLCAAFLKVQEGVSFDEDSVPDVWIYRWYESSLRWSMRHRWVIVALSVGSLVATFAVFGQTNRGVELFPSTTPEKFTIKVEMPDGTRLAETDKVLEELTKPLEREDSGLVNGWIVDTGVQGGSGGMAGGGTAPHYGRVSVELLGVEDQPRDPDDFMETLRNVYQNVAGASIVLEKQDMGPPTGAPVSIEVHGEDLQTLGAIARKVRERVRPIPGIIDLQDDLELSRPEVQVLVNRQQAALAGLDTRTISSTIRTAVNGTEASVFREGDEEYDIMVRLQEESRGDIEDIRSLTVVNRDKFHIPLEEVADVEVRSGTGSIRHKDQERVVTVTANAAEGYLAQNLMEEARSRMEDINLPPGYEVKFTGEQEDRKEASDFLVKALLAALFIIALVLVTEFDSIVQPFIILCSVLLSLLGVLWSLILTGEPFGIIMTGIGIISLAGVVVNNAIVMIDYINKLRDRGEERRDSVIKGGLVRFRPVVLTAVTTIGGLLPIVLGVSIDFVNLDIIVGGNSVEMWGPMARAVTSGLLIATFLTLIVVPVLYSLFDDLSQFGQKLVRGGTAAGVVVMTLSLAWPAFGQQAPEGPADTAASQEQAVDSGDEDEADEPPTDAAAAGLRGPSAGDDLKLSRGESDLEKFDIDADRQLTLSEVRETAVERNFDVKLAETQVDVAEAKVRGAYSYVLPSVNAAGNYIINEDEVAFSIDPGIQGVDIPETVVQPKYNWNWEVSARLSLSGQALPGINIAYNNEDRVRRQLDLTKDQIDFAAVQLYYNMLVVRQVIEINQQQLASSRTMLDATERRVNAGVATKFELTRAEMRVVQAEKSVEQSRQQFIQLRHSMAQLLQTDPNFDVVAPSEVEVDMDTAQLKDEAGANRIEMEIQEINEDISQLSVTEVWTRYLPTLSSTFSYSDAKDTGLNPAPPQWALVFGANWTLWDGGMREAELREKRAQLVAARLQEKRQLDEIRTNIEKAHSEYSSAKTQVESSQTQVELAEQGLEQAQLGYENGVTSQLQLIDAEDQLRIAKINLARDRLQMQLNARRLLHLAGLN
ncbi:MAG: efflux RND transporter permease subunit [Myxococcota bacterium]